MSLKDIHKLQWESLNMGEVNHPIINGFKKPQHLVLFPSMCLCIGAGKSAGRTLSKS